MKRIKNYTKKKRQKKSIYKSEDKRLISFRASCTKKYIHIHTHAHTIKAIFVCVELGLLASLLSTT